MVATHQKLSSCHLNVKLGFMETAQWMLREFDEQHKAGRGPLAGMKL